MDDENADIEEHDDDIDPTRVIKSIGVKLSSGNAICELNLADQNDEEIVDIEWENCYVGRSWKVKYIPEGHELIGMVTHTKDKSKLITRMGFICRKKLQK